MNSGNYLNAKKEADRIDKIIIDTLDEGKSFKVEAGAGSGKTYSLMKVIEWLRDKKQSEFEKNNKKVVCITYTNAAVNIILERLPENSFIIPSTIHSFAWENIKQFQKELLKLIKKNNISNEEINIKKVNYTLGIKFVQEEVLYLNHNDVINLFVELMDNKKFRKILSSKFPIILIDEYQDTNKKIIEKFLKYYIDKNEGIQFGFFGDSWQTIYQSNDACGNIEHNNIKIINKTSNFRSAPLIVDFLNKIKSETPQISAIEDTEGEVIIIHCNDYKDSREIKGAFKGDLPEEELEKRIEQIKEKYSKIISKEKKLKILMLTHKILSKYQKYDNLLEIMGEDFKNVTDELLLYTMEIVLPMITALKNKDASKLFEILKTRPVIKNKKEKKKWELLYENFIKAEKGTIKDVLTIIKNSNMIPLSNKIENIYKNMCENPDEIYNNNKTFKQLSDIQFKEFENGIIYLKKQGIFSTEHGVKGEEYDTVVFVVSRGWNNYQYDKWIPKINKNISIENKEAYERNRNLFYVCCSRPTNRLIIFVTFELKDEFLVFFEKNLGKEKILNFNDFLSQNF